MAKWRRDLSVHFAENRPNPQRRVLLCSLLPHFWYTGDSSLTMCYFLKHFEEFIAQDASSCYVQVRKLTNTNHAVFVCVCVCVLSVCVLYHMITHLVNNSAYIRICLTSITLCSIRTYICLWMQSQHTQQYSMLSKCAENFNAWVASFQQVAHSS